MVGIFSLALASPTSLYASTFMPFTGYPRACTCPGRHEDPDCLVGRHAKPVTSHLSTNFGPSKQPNSGLALRDVIWLILFGIPLYLLIRVSGFSGDAESPA